MKTSNKAGHPSSQKPRIRLPAKRIDVAERLQLDLDPKPRGAWEGKLLGATGSAADREVFVQAELRVVGQLIEGEGRAPKFPRPQPNSRFALDGVVEGGKVEMAMWFEAELVSSIPFLLSGELDHEQRSIKGEWSCGCFQPETCACGGARGTFHLYRVG